MKSMFVKMWSYCLDWHRRIWCNALCTREWLLAVTAYLYNQWLLWVTNHNIEIFKVCLHYWPIKCHSCLPLTSYHFYNWERGQNKEKISYKVGQLHKNTLHNWWGVYFISTINEINEGSENFIDEMNICLTGTIFYWISLYLASRDKRVRLWLYSVLIVIRFQKSHYCAANSF